MGNESGPQQAEPRAQAGATVGVTAGAQAVKEATARAGAKTESAAKAQAKIGLVLPVYNRAVSWRAAAESVLAQDRLPDALVIVDDGSNDKTATKVRQWLGQQDHSKLELTLIEQPHKNASAARNRGLAYLRGHGGDAPSASARLSGARAGRESNGCSTPASSSSHKSSGTKGLQAGCYEYIGFLDSDDVLPPDFISRAYAALSQDEDVAAVSVPRASYEDGHIACDDLSDFARAPLEWMLYYGAAILSCSLFRAASIPERGFDEELEIGEDLVFATEVSLRGKWLAAAGLSTSFQRRTVPKTELSSRSASESNLVSDASPKPPRASHEQQPLTQKYNPNEGLEAALLAIAVRKRAVRIHNASSPRRINSAYWQYVMSMWYLLASRQGRGLTRCRLLMRALLHRSASLVCRSIGV